jgi:integrase
VQINGDSADTKSDAGWRVVGVPPALVSCWCFTAKSRRAVVNTPDRCGGKAEWVFTSDWGPLTLNSDYYRRKALLRDAGVRDGRLHDARHTAATVRLALGVPERTVTGIMGWSSTAMAARLPGPNGPDPVSGRGPDRRAVVGVEHRAPTLERDRN